MFRSRQGFFEDVARGRILHGQGVRGVHGAVAVARFEAVQIVVAIVVGKAAAQPIGPASAVADAGDVAHRIVCVRDIVQAAVGCGGGEGLKPARGRIVNIRRRNAIAVFEVCAAAEFVVLDVVDVVLNIRFGALYVDELAAVVVFYLLSVGIQNGVNTDPDVLFPIG